MCMMISSKLLKLHSLVLAAQEMCLITAYWLAQDIRFQGLSQRYMRRQFSWEL